MAAPLSVTAPSSVQNLMNSSSRRSIVSRGVLMIETMGDWDSILFKEPFNSHKDNNVFFLVLINIYDIIMCLLI